MGTVVQRDGKAQAQIGLTHLYLITITQVMRFVVMVALY